MYIIPRVMIVEPKKAVILSNLGYEVVPVLIKLLYDKNRDWAAHVLLTSITGHFIARREVTSGYTTKNEIIRWRKYKKKSVIIYWKKWLTENKNVNSFFDHGLREFPRSALKTKQLEKLILSFNRLTELPAKIGQLTNLTELDLSNNWLLRLTPQIGKLVKLRKLVLKNNVLNELPEEIKNLTKLKKLDLRNNLINDSEKAKIRKLLPNCEIVF